MKNYFYKLLFACFLTATSYSQQVNNTEFKTKTLQVFQNLDKNRIPHGILLDFGMEFTNLKAFNGTLTDSTFTTSQTMSDIYKTLLMCRVRSNVTTGFITPEEYATRWYTQRTSGVLILSGQYFKYNRFADNAYPSKLNYSNNQFSDKFIGSTWQNPYEEKQLFAMTPSISSYKGLSFKVKLPANLFFSNYPTTIQNIQVDFSDGLGYRVIAYDQLVNVDYTVANTYTWKYKITLTNGQTLLSHSKVVIEGGLNAVEIGASCVGCRTTTQTQTSTNPDPALAIYSKKTISSTTPYLGYNASATIYIRYAQGGNTIRKPLIVAEGFDDGIILKPEQEAGSNNINDFLFSVNNSVSILPAEMDTYDIIYVDWNNGVTFLQRNAYVLQEVIKWVNDNKTTTTQNVVLGQSMGGLIARYALKDMENRGLQHDTRLYVSHDAPHLGANTPVSVQMSARHLRNLYVNTPVPLVTGEIIVPLIYNFAEGFSSIINFFGGNTTVPPFITPLQAFSLADTPATRQMTYNWVNFSSGIDTTIHDAWQQDLANIGYPAGTLAKPIRNIAIANGSECGVTQTDNVNIMSYVKDAGRDTFLSNYIGILDAVYGAVVNNPIVTIAALFPGSSYWRIDFQSKYMTSLNENKNIYKGYIGYKKKVFWFIPISIAVTDVNRMQPTGVLPYDIYGGGIHRTSPNQLPISGIISNGFGFIPTASSLDVGKWTTPINDSDYRRSFVGGQPPVAPKNSPFQNFVTGFVENNPTASNSRHISFNTRNGNWLQAELDITTADEYTNCSFICSGTSGSQISGNNGVCGMSIFSVPSGADSYNWYITEGANLVSLTGNGTNSVTITPVSTTTNGYVTLNVYYGSSTCGFVTTSKRMIVGVSNINIQTYENDDICFEHYNYAGYVVYGSASGVQFSDFHSAIPSEDKLIYAMSNGFQMDGIGRKYLINIPRTLLGEQISYNITYVNQCGELVTQPGDIPIVANECSSNLRTASTNTFTIYPNPATTTINVALFDETKVPAKKAHIVGKLYDLNNNEKVKVVINDNSAQIDSSSLNRGVYILKIDIDGKVESHQVIVK